MTTIYLDLETIGTDDTSVIAEIADSIKPPGNISKPESIEKWMAENKKSAIDKAVGLTGLDGGLGRIICIGFAINDEEPDSFSAPFKQDERAAIQGFFAEYKKASDLHYSGGVVDNPPVVVGHNVIGFDLRFLWQRCVVLGITHPTRFPFDRQQQNRGVYDTMLQWNPDRDKRTSLDKLCKMLGVSSPKEKMSGADVWGFFKEGRINDIAEYCRADITATRECYKRMTFAP
jgi:hypothetical protein